MVESEHDVALQDTDRIEGRSALVNNVNAAIALAGAIRSTLGPRGADKMLVDENGSVLVTNDGVTVLETAKVEHPTANLLIATSSAQDRVARDGTTTSVLLTAELLRNALELSRIGVHPSLIMKGYQLACEESMKQIEMIARDADDKQMKDVISTTLAGKVDSSLAGKMTELALEAANILSSIEGSDDVEKIRVKRLQISSGKASDSELVRGLVVRKKRLDSSTPKDSETGRIVVLDGGFEPLSLELDAQIEINDTGVISGFQKRKITHLERMVKSLKDNAVDLLCVRDGISDEAIPMLRDAGITSYRRFEREDLERICILTGSSMIRDMNRLKKSDTGSYLSRFETKINDTWHLTIEGEGEAMTAIIKGTTPIIREESERAFDDALGVAFRLVNNPFILPGGGATQIHLARHLRAYSTSQRGREQLAIEGFADALEIIPRVLSENAGLDPIDNILALSAQQSEKGEWIGLDAMSGKICDVSKSGIHDPLFVSSQAIIGATEAAISVLRIDDVLWAKVEPSTPDWNHSEDED
tara:strand:- start:46084 stop:47679 length:1596 start_codon:yes stop_codon:yes gene_type:complete